MLRPTRTGLVFLLLVLFIWNLSRILAPPRLEVNLEANAQRNRSALPAAPHNRDVTVKSEPARCVELVKNDSAFSRDHIVSPVKWTWCFSKSFCVSQKELPPLLLAHLAAGLEFRALSSDLSSLPHCTVVSRTYYADVFQKPRQKSPQSVYWKTSCYHGNWETQNTSVVVSAPENLKVSLWIDSNRYSSQAVLTYIRNWTDIQSLTVFLEGNRTLRSCQPPLSVSKPNPLIIVDSSYATESLEYLVAQCGPIPPQTAATLFAVQEAMKRCRNVVATAVIGHAAQTKTGPSPMEPGLRCWNKKLMVSRSTFIFPRTSIIDLVTSFFLSPRRCGTI